jgi:hypothetical protein
VTSMIGLQQVQSERYSAGAAPRVRGQREPVRAGDSAGLVGLHVGPWMMGYHVCWANPKIRKTGNI